MITLCAQCAFSGTITDRIKALFVALAIDSIYIIPAILTMP